MTNAVTNQILKRHFVVLLVKGFNATTTIPLEQALDSSTVVGIIINSDLNRMQLISFQLSLSFYRHNIVVLYSITISTKSKISKA